MFYSPVLLRAVGRQFQWYAVYIISGHTDFQNEHNDTFSSFDVESGSHGIVLLRFFEYQNGVVVAFSRVKNEPNL